MRFSEYALVWVNSYRGRTARGFSESTRELYRRDLNALILRFFGNYWLDDVDAGDVSEWFNWVEDRGVSVSGIRKAKAPLGALFATVEERKARFNPVRGVRYVPSRDVPQPREIEPLTLTELGRLMEALPGEWQLFFLLLAHTGLRIGEALALTWMRVNLGADPKLTVVEQVYKGERKPPKTANSKRALPLSSGMARALANWRSRTSHSADEDRVFASSTGSPLDYANVRREVWVPARDAAGIDPDQYGAFHRLRNTLASIVHERPDKTDRQLCDWLGHHDPAFSVRRYTGTMDDGLGSADFLDELIPVDGRAMVGR